MSLRERPFLYDVMGGSLKIRFSNGCCCIKVSLRFGSPMAADIFIQDRDNSLHFSWSSSKRGASLGTIVATSIELHCSVEGAVGEGISLTEDQFEELQTVRPMLAVTKVPRTGRTNWPVQYACAYALQQAGSSSRKVSRISRYHSNIQAQSEVTEVCVRA